MTVSTLRRRAIVLVASTAVVGAVLALPAAAAPDQPRAIPIRLVSGEFVPATGGALPSKPGLQAKTLDEAARGSYLVQFDGPVQSAWTAAVTATGAELVEYVPDFAFKARMTPGQARRVAKLSEVNWVGRFQPSWKISADARQRLDAGRPAVYRVRAERGAALAAVGKAAQDAGAVASTTGHDTLLVAADPGQLAAIANAEDTAWIDEFRIPRKHNESGAGGIIRATAANQRGYDGSTQIVAVADTGLGGGTAATAHPDIPAGRIVAIHARVAADAAGCYDVQGNGAEDVDSGHGTHVATSVVGDGNAAGVGKAAAYAARLVFQAVEDWVDFTGACQAQYTDGYYLLGLPDDLAQLFQQAYDGGARIHSNSWGSDAFGAYTDNAAQVDRFVNGHRDMLVTFSAGNDGTDANSDGAVDNDSIGSPATAKNVLTVGASENERASYPCDASLTYQSTSTKEQATTGNRSCQQLGGQNPLPTWGAWWPDSFPAAPVSTDAQAGNDQQMAAFSSRGPTDDGRIKPDVVAPGSWILSGYSDRYQQQYDGATNPKNGAYQHDGYGYPYSGTYKYLSGTSMSNPIAAGGAAVVRDFYHERHGVTGASAALVKATLINSADDMLDENNDGADDNDFPIPNAHEGWGRLNLDRATAGTARFVDEAAGLATGALSTQQYTLAAGAPLRVTLAWSDREAATTAAVTLVNDLDLEVVAPDGTTYRGNAFSGGWSATGGAADRRNNVENVYLRSAAAGTWTVRVRGFNVPSGPQRFALVVDGSFGSGGGENTNPTITNPGNQSTAIGTAVSRQISASDADGDPLTYGATGLPAGLSIGAANGLISGTPSGPAGVSNVTVTVTDGRGGSASASFTWTITSTQQQLLANPGFESGVTGWSGTTTVITNSTARPAHGGSYWAWFGGYGRSASENLYQQVTIPATAASATVSFWVRIDTAETTTSVAYDTLRLQVLNGSGTVLATVGTLSNLNKSSSYVLKSYDVSAYRGQTIRVRWLLTEDSTLQTTFATDDVALTVT